MGGGAMEVGTPGAQSSLSESGLLESTSVDWGREDTAFSRSLADILVLLEAEMYNDYFILIMEYMGIHLLALEATLVERPAEMDRLPEAVPYV